MNELIKYRRRNKNYDYGIKKEYEIMDILKDFFKVSFLKLDKYDVFDFMDFKRKKYIEVKSRRCCADTYNYTLIGFNKYEEALKKINEGYKVYFVFYFTDTIKYINVKKLKHFYIENRKNKKYLYIDVRYLKLMKNILLFNF